MSVDYQHTSYSAEQYTPAEIVEPSRAVLGAIDLDPFSCLLANTIVKATRYFTVSDDGFSQPWAGRVFCNPPGGSGAERSNQKRAWFKLMAEVHRCVVTSAIFVCFDLGLLQTTQHKPPRGLRLPLDFPICYPARRIPYLSNVLPGPTPKRPNRKPTAKQLEDFARTGMCTGESPPHPSCIVGVGVNHARFREAFAPLGKVVIPR